MTERNVNVKVTANGLAKVNKDSKTLSKTLDKINSSANKQHKIFGLVTKKTQNWSDKFAELGGKGNHVTKLFNTFNTGFSEASHSGLGFFSSLSKGFKAVSKAFVTGGLTMQGVLIGLGTTLATVLLPLAAIAAGFYLLKKAWEVNMGGIQTLFNKVMGKLKSWWGVFEVKLIHGMRKVGDAISSFFKLFNSKSEESKKTWKALGIVLRWSFKVAFAPMISIIKGMTILFKVINWIAKSKFGGMLIKTFKQITLPIRTIWFLLKNVIIWVDKWSKRSKQLQKEMRSSTKPLEIIHNIFNKIKNIFNKFKQTNIGGALLKPFTMLLDTLKPIWNFLTKIMDKYNEIANSDIGKFMGMQTFGSPSADIANNTNNQNSRIVNNNQTITMNTGRAANPNNAEAFGAALAKHIQMN